MQWPSTISLSAVQRRLRSLMLWALIVTLNARSLRASDKEKRFTILASPFGKDAEHCGLPGNPLCRSFRKAVDEAQDARVDVDMEPGIYLTGTEFDEVHAVISKSVRIRSTRGTAVVDCGGKGSAVDVIASSNIRVVFEGITFRNCSSGRRWRIGPIPDWCLAGTANHWEGPFGCACSLRYCSRGGAVTITESKAGVAQTGLVVKDFSVAFVGCAFEDNRADRGGAVQVGLFHHYVRPTIQFIRCDFTRNVARKLGGAAVDFLVDTAYTPQRLPPVEDDSDEFKITAVAQFDMEEITAPSVVLRSATIWFEECNFVRNKGRTEGTIALWGVSGGIDGFMAKFSDCNFFANTGGNGGALAFHFPNPIGQGQNLLLFDRVRFVGNVARDSSVGGAVMLAVPKSYTLPRLPRPREFRAYEYRIHVITQDSVFMENHAYVGGAYVASNGRQIFRNVSFLSNTAKHTGGAVCLGCVGGGDAGFEAVNVTFSRNKASVAGSAFSSAASGAIALSDCRFDLEGSHQGLTDFEASNAGPFQADSTTSWRCQENQQLLKPRTTVSQGMSGLLDPAWNHDSISVLINHIHISCFWCAPLTYSLIQPVLSGPVISNVSSADHPITRQGHLNVPSFCAKCPFGGSCAGNESAVLALPGQFGLSCRRKSPQAPHTVCGAGRIRFAANIIFVRCPSGYCGGGPWSSPCAGNRIGLLCGICQPNHTRTLGSTHCVRNDECSVWWLLPVGMTLAMYALYCYTTAANPYSIWDMFIFHYQLFGYVVFEREALVILSAWLSANLDVLSLGQKKRQTIPICFKQDLDQVTFALFSYALVAVVLLMIISFHFVGLRWLLPASWSINSYDMGRRMRSGSEALGLAVVKGYLGVFNTLIGTTVQLVHCVKIPGIDHPRLFRVADVECFRIWQVGLLVLLPLLLLTMVVPICLPADCCSGEHSHSVKDAVMATVQDVMPVARAKVSCFQTCVWRLRAVAHESGMFRADRWWAPQAFALSRALFASAPALFPSPAQRSVANALLLVGVMIAMLVFMPFAQKRMQFAQILLLVTLQAVGAFQIGDSYLETTASMGSQEASLISIRYAQNFAQGVALGLPGLVAVLLLSKQARERRQEGRSFCFTHDCLLESSDEEVQDDADAEDDQSVKDEEEDETD